MPLLGAPSVVVRAYMMNVEERGALVILLFSHARSLAWRLRPPSLAVSTPFHSEQRPSRQDVPALTPIHHPDPIISLPGFGAHRNNIRAGIRLRHGERSDVLAR